MITRVGGIVPAPDAYVGDQGRGATVTRQTGKRAISAQDMVSALRMGAKVVAGFGAIVETGCTPGAKYHHDQVKEA